MSLLPKTGKCFYCGHDHGEGLGSPRELELISRIGELQKQIEDFARSSKELNPVAWYDPDDFTRTVSRPTKKEWCPLVRGDMQPSAGDTK